MVLFLIKYFWIICLVAVYVYMWIDAIKAAIKNGNSNYLQGMGVITIALLFFASIIYFFCTN